MEFGNEILKKINKDTNKESIIKDILGYLDKEFKKENIDVERISSFFLELKWTLKEKSMEEEFEMIENIYLLDEKNMMKLINSADPNFLFLLRKFYSESGFFEFYLIVLKKMENIIVKNNLFMSLGKEFVDLNIQLENYIQYLKDRGEYFEIYKGDVFYDVFWTVIQPFVKNIIKQKDDVNVMKLLIFLERMVQSPEKYIEVLLRDTIIEGGWLEENEALEKYIGNFGDNFLILYALVYDGRVF